MSDAEKVADPTVAHSYSVMLRATIPSTISLDDFSGLITQDLSLRDRSLTQLLEIITSQVIFYR